MTRKLAISGAALVLTGLGLWLWSRNGMAVFLDAMVAFCA